MVQVTLNPLRREELTGREDVTPEGSTVGNVARQALDSQRVEARSGASLSCKVVLVGGCCLCVVVNAALIYLATMDP